MKIRVREVNHFCHLNVNVYEVHCQDNTDKQLYVHIKSKLKQRLIVCYIFHNAKFILKLMFGLLLQSLVAAC